MWVTNKFGKVHFIPEDIANQKIKQGVARKSTDSEIGDKERHRLMSGLIAAEDGGKSIYYQTVSKSADGYGMSRDLMKKELFNTGVFLSENMVGQKVGLLYNYPYGITQMHNDVRIIFTMFESDRIPEEWPEYLKQANQVIVPSTWCQETFARQGVDATVVPLGYNSDVFEYIDRPVPFKNEEPFTFIHYNSFNIRKGFIEVFNAFTEEFSEKDNVKLILKTTTEKPPIPVMPDQYPNIEVVKGTLSEEELSNLLARSHCMVYPSRGEGFGITPLEAMATGLPAIVPNAHGISEYFDPEYMLEVKVEKMIPGIYRRFIGTEVGQMVQVDVEDLRKQMRYAYNHQQEMKALGKKASEYVKAYTYKETAKKLGTILKHWQDVEVPKRADAEYLEVTEV